MSEESLDAAVARLQEAIKNAPHEQQALLAATDALFEVLEEAGERVDDAHYLEARMLLSHAESLLTRYFGM
ncbi:MAG TPA: hypothetical protein V6D47_07100 [Oscillatoriaceae cyanobacterium]